MPCWTNLAVFFNIVQKPLNPPPPCLDFVAKSRSRFWRWSLIKILKLKFVRYPEAEFWCYLKAVTLVKELYPQVRCAFDNVFEIRDVLTGENELVGNCWARNLLTPSIQKSILNNCRLIHLLLLRLMYVPIEIIVYSNVAYISNILYPIPLTQREQFFWFTESAWKFQYLIEPTVLNRNCNFFTKHACWF